MPICFNQMRWWNNVALELGCGWGCFASFLSSLTHCWWGISFVVSLCLFSNCHHLPRHIKWNDCPRNEDTNWTDCWLNWIKFLSVMHRDDVMTGESIIMLNIVGLRRKSIRWVKINEFYWFLWANKLLNAAKKRRTPNSNHVPSNRKQIVGILLFSSSIHLAFKMWK